MPDSALVQTLRNFNRKERYWVIRNAFSEQDEPLRLSTTFRRQLGAVIGATIPGDAWWAMDYHINWLLGAALSLRNNIGPGDSGARKQKNKNVHGLEDEAQLIEQNQQDVDFIVAFDDTIVLLEAKFSSGWRPQQLDSKLVRINTFRSILPERIRSRVHFVLWSPEAKARHSKGDILPWDESQPATLELWKDSDPTKFWTINRSNRDGDDWSIMETPY